MQPSEAGQAMGHEAIGVVAEVGAGVSSLKAGDVAVMPFAFSDGTCVFCHEGLHTGCLHGGFFGVRGSDGAQAEALRVPQADGTLLPLGVGEDDALMPSLLTLSDVLGTGHHAAVVARPCSGARLYRRAPAWRVVFFINVPLGIVAMLAAPRYLPDIPRHRGRLELVGALSSTLGAVALVFGIVHSAEAGWGDPTTLGAVAIGLALVGFFIAHQARSAQPIMPLRVFADRERTGAYAARFLFNGALLSSFYFLTLYLQGVSRYTPLQAGLAFLSQTVAAFAIASTVPALTRRIGTPIVAIIGVGLMVIATAWLSRLSAHTACLTGVAQPMVFYGAAQGLALSSLTTAGMAGVAPRDAGVAGGLVNIAHHLGGALGLGILTTVFAMASAPGAAPGELFARRVGGAFTGGVVLSLIALAVTVLVARSARADAPRRRRGPNACARVLDEPAGL